MVVRTTQSWMRQWRFESARGYKTNLLIMELDIKISILLYGEKNGKEKKAGLVVGSQFIVQEFPIDEMRRDEKLSIMDEITKAISDKVEEINARRLGHSD